MMLKVELKASKHGIIFKVTDDFCKKVLFILFFEMLQKGGEK